ncbi:hypothetical protein N0V94_007465 [Neodidymelliopsis sp. IMI 364377]|nr:hypothetical protein N0V94_007465 [Neodidymelliopsis sp. IMI 364377]
MELPLFQGDEQEKRCARTNLTFIEYRPETKPQVTPITSDIALAETLDTLSNDTSAPPLRLFLVEDLSRRVIELLGSRFDVDPLFFREQIQDYVWNNTRDPWAMPASLVASKKQRSWFQLRNVRLRYHRSEESLEVAREQASMWNVLRRPDNDNNHWHYRDEYDGEEKAATNKGVETDSEEKNTTGKKIQRSAVSIIRTRTTIWIGKDKKCGNGTVAIVLIDPTMKEGTPLWHDRTNWLPTTSMEEMAARQAREDDSPPLVELSKSWYEDIVQMTAAYPWFEAASGHKIDSKVLAYPTIYTICAEWLVVCDYLKTRLSQIEWEIEMPAVFRSKGDAIDSSLKRLHTWRRHIPVFRDMITEAIEQALPTALKLTTNPKTDKDTTEAFPDIKPDFERVLKALEELQARVDRLTEIVVSEISIEDSKLGLEENHNLARLTWLATTFIPLSFVSAFFSMNEDVTALRHTYGWFFLAAIPFTAFVMFLGWLVGGGPLGQRMVKKKEEFKRSSWYDKVKFR